MTSLPQQPPPFYHLPPYRSARTLATLTIASLLVSMSGSLYELVVEFQGYALVGDLHGGGDVSQASLDAYDAKIRSVTLWSLAATALCATMFCMWIVRASKNVQATGRPLKMSPGWAAGSFFLPILSLWRPYIAVANVWEMSDPDLGPDRPSAGGGFVISWWAFWITSGVVDLQAGPDEVQSAADMRGQMIASVASAGLSILAGAFAILIVHRLTRRQEVFAERFMVPAAQAMQR
jgi:hypothetical protein